MVTASTPVMPQAGLALTQNFLDDHPEQATALLAGLAGQQSR